MNRTLKSGGILNRLAKPVDLINGTPWRSILIYAVPIMLSYLLQQIYILTDSIICGQVLTSGEVAGINDTFALTFIFLQFAFGCTAGFSVVTAKCVGSKDSQGTRRSFTAQVCLSAVISAVLTALSLLLLPWMLGVINVTPENAEVYNAAYVYCFVIFIGIFAQMGYNFICGILRAYGDSVTPLIFLIISTVLNVALDIVFLVPLSMGPAGAAIATVLAQFLSFVGCCAYMFSKYKELRPQKDDWKFRFDDLAAHLKNGLPLGFQFSILAIGIIVMQGVVVKFDLGSDGIMAAMTPAQNGFGAASKLINFLMAFFNGLASAILGFNAQNFGSKHYDRIKKGTLHALIIMLVIYAVCLAAGLLLGIGGRYQYIFMSADKVTAESIRFGGTCLVIDMTLCFILGFLIVTRSAVQGIFKPSYSLAAGIAELVARTLICIIMPPLINGGAIDKNASVAAFAALCFGDPGAWIAASLVLLYPLFRYIIKCRYKNDVIKTAPAE